MSFERLNLDWLIIAILVGMSPLIILGLRRVWKWYHNIQRSSIEDLGDHVRRIEEDYKK